MFPTIGGEMVRIELPYGQTRQEADVPAPCVRAVLSPPGHGSQATGPVSSDEQSARIVHALDTPIGAPRLEDLAVGKRTATIITSDHTRPVPSHLTLPHLLARLRLRNPDIAVTILVTDLCDPAVVRAMHMEHAATLQEAVDRALKDAGPAAGVTVIPDGVGVIVDPV